MRYLSVVVVLAATLWLASPTIGLGMPSAVERAVERWFTQRSGSHTTPAAQRHKTAARALDAAAMLAAHNGWRNGRRLPAMGWSDSMAELSQDWAQRLASQGCPLRHRPPAQRPNLGENLYWASALRWDDGRREAQPIDPGDVVDSWGGEEKWYDHENHRCAAPPGRTCGHYTQVMWQDSRSVGCAMAMCPDLSQVWVCNYDPAGNVVGETPF